MKNVLGFLILCVVSLFTVHVNALEQTCDFQKRAELNKYAFNVKAEYEFKKRDDGSTYFDIVLYNIVDSIYVNYKSENEGNDSAGVNVAAANTDNGTYRFSIPIPTSSFDYNFVVRTLDTGCPGNLRRFTLTIPIRNSFHDLDDCKREGMEDYFYCKEWIIQEFNISETEIKEKIAEKYQSLKKNVKTKCVGCEEKARNEALIANFKKFKMQVIIGLSIGIVVDLIIMILQIRNIRRNEI